MVEKALAERTTTAKPLPRILFIGDSTSGYYQYVRAALEGKAAVYKNPGNGEHSDNGVKRIDEWLNLDTYHLNGEEYRELVNCVEAVFENPNVSIQVIRERNSNLRVWSGSRGSLTAIGREAAAYERTWHV